MDEECEQEEATELQTNGEEAPDSRQQEQGLYPTSSATSSANETAQLSPPSTAIQGEREDTSLRCDILACPCS